jgi:hypothetical protein
LGVFGLGASGDGSIEAVDGAIYGSGAGYCGGAGGFLHRDDVWVFYRFSVVDVSLAADVSAKQARGPPDRQEWLMTDTIDEFKRIWLWLPSYKLADLWH